jgi:hypothetical protein
MHGGDEQDLTSNEGGLICEVLANSSTDSPVLHVIVVLPLVEPPTLEGVLALAVTFSCRHRMAGGGE